MRSYTEILDELGGLERRSQSYQDKIDELYAQKRKLNDELARSLYHTVSQQITDGHIVLGEPYLLHEFRVPSSSDSLWCLLETLLYLYPDGSLKEVQSGELIGETQIKDLSNKVDSGALTDDDIIKNLLNLLGSESINRQNIPLISG